MSSGGGLLGGHLEALRGKREQVWQDMVAAIQDEEPAYTRFATREDEAEWAEGVLRLFDLFLELAEDERRRLTHGEVGAIRATGAKRADQGFDFPALRTSVRAAVGVARKYIVDEYAPSGPEDKAALGRVLELLAWYGSQVEDLLHEALDARNNERVANGARKLRQLVDDIESGRVSGDSQLVHRVAAVGCEPVDRGLVLLSDDRAGTDLAAILQTRLAGVSVLRRSDAATPHVLVIIGAPEPERWRSVIAVVQAATAELATTALAVDPCRTAVEYQDRYAASVVLVPHLGRLAKGPSVLDAVELTHYSVVASLPPTARQWLRRDILRGIDTVQKLFDFLGLSIKLNFTLNAIEQATGWDMKTVRRRRAALEEATARRYADPGDQAALTLGYCAACLDG